MSVTTAPERRPPPLVAAVRSRPVTAVCLALMLTMSCVYMLSTGGHVYSIDEDTMLATTRALVDGQRQLDVTPANNQVLLVAPHRNGEQVGVFGIGTSALAVAPLLGGTAVAGLARAERPELIKRLWVLWTNSIVTAAIVVVLFLLCLELGASLRGALLLSLAYGLGTCAWAHAKTLFSEPPVALLLTLAVFLAVRSMRRNDRKLLFWSGVCAAATVLFRVNSVIFVPPLIAYVACAASTHVRERVDRVITFSAGLAAMGVVVGATNAWRFGSPTDTGYAVVPFTTHFADGFFGLLLSPGRGILFYAPVTAVAFAIPFAVRVRRADVALLFALFAVDLLFFSRFTPWYGGATWGPRYLEPVLPALIATLAIVVDRAPWRRWIVTLAAVGATITLLAGVLTYFNAVAWRDLPRVEAETKSTPVTNPAALESAALWVPHDSPIILGLRYLPEAIRHTVSHIDGPARPLPATENRFVQYYGEPLQLDTWWAWWLPSGGWPPLLALAPLLAFGAAFGARRLRSVWRDLPTYRTDLDLRIDRFSGKT